MNHIKILKQGVDFWNKWRKKNPDIKPDLQGADLSGADLIAADLSGADLSSADLIGADLIGADLFAAVLIGADLRYADLRGAVLRRAVLRRAVLIGANLSGADLSGADLEEADLEEADLWGANLLGVKYPINKFNKKALLETLITTLKQEGNELKMRVWHTCDTSHCVAGWLEELCPEIKEVSKKTGNIAFAVGLAYPSLVKDGVLWNYSLSKKNAIDLLNGML